jgi:putative transposon-encoded protein
MPRKVNFETTNELTLKGIVGFVKRKVTPHGTGAKVTCPKEYLGKLKLIGEFFESGKASDRRAKPRLLTMEDFRQILEERKPSVSFDMLAQYDRWFEAFKAL